MKYENSFSRIIAGTMTWGSWGKQLSENEMIALLAHCIEITSLLLIMPIFTVVTPRKLTLEKPSQKVVSHVRRFS